MKNIIEDFFKDNCDWTDVKIYLSENGLPEAFWWNEQKVINFCRIIKKNFLQL